MDDMILYIGNPKESTKKAIRTQKVGQGYKM